MEPKTNTKTDDIQKYEPGKPSGSNVNFYIVGMGASAGGFAAFEQFFSKMPADSGMAFVLVPHLAPAHKSMMAELLKRRTKMSVVEVEEGMEARPNSVYVIPPNKAMALRNGAFHLLEPVEIQGIRHPIDFFFRSLAEDRDRKAIGIILAGTGSEGSLGLRALKEKGGLVIAQEPKSAGYEGMPSSAIATGLVDHVLPPDKMPELLLRYVRHRETAPVIAAPAEGKQVDPLQGIFDVIRAQTGNDFSQYRSSTIIARIEKRMALHQIQSLPDYAAYLRDNPEEVKMLFDELLVRVTSFFRDKEAFEVLKEKALPLIFRDRSADQPVRVWIPGCSTGEEAYSIAIIIAEYMHTLKKFYKVQIFASDIDRRSIDIARHGTYPDNIIVDVSPERLDRFFTKQDSDYKVKDEIRDRILFAVHNAVKDPPFSRLDMLICRNLLIYLSDELQAEVLPVFYYALKPEGILFLGSSEDTGELADRFSEVDRKWRIFQAKRGAPAPVPLHGLVPIPRQKTAAAEKRVEQERPAADISPFVERFLIDSYAPPAVIVDGKGDIRYFHGRTGRYLEPVSGKARLNIIEMAREGLKPDMRVALHKAAALKKTVTVQGVRVKTDGRMQAVDLEIRYIEGPAAVKGLLAVAFREQPLPKGRKRERTRPAARAERSRRAADLESELKSTKADLQTTIEKLETSNEELQSANEELQSSNEEMQSANEQLETSREELQSTNEELTTLNTEYQHKIEEVSQMNDDMSNLMGSTEIATIFLDNDLRIKRFTPEMVQMFNFIPSDLGRPLGDIVLRIDYPEIEEDIREVLRTTALKEKTVRHRDGSWYLTRILPYRTLRNVIDGVVISFINITGQKEARDYAEGIIDTVWEPLIILDAGLRVITANSSFYRTFKATPEETEGKFLYDLGIRQWDIRELRERLQKIIPENIQVENFEVDREFPGIGHRSMLLCARRIHQHGKPTRTILLAFDDVTERKKAEEIRARLAAIIESSDEVIFSKSLDGIIQTWNRAAERIYGYPADEAIGRPVSMLVPPDRPDETPGIMERMKRGERIEHYETVRMRKDGTRITISLTVSPVRDPAGRVTGASTIAHEITERKREVA